MRDDPSDKPIDDLGQPQEQQVNPSATNDLDLFASRLAMFGARSVSLDREAILFAAGQASCEPVKTYRRFDSSYRAWQASTVAMTLLSIVLGSMLAWRPESTPQIMIVERQPSAGSKQAAISSLPSEILPTPEQLSSNHHSEITPVLDPNDSRLADAWKARQEIIRANEKLERQLATTSPGIEGRSSFEQPLTRSSLLDNRSQVTIQHWLKEQL